MQNAWNASTITRVLGAQACHRLVLSLWHNRTSYGFFWHQVSMATLHFELSLLHCTIRVLSLEKACFWHEMDPSNSWIFLFKKPTKSACCLKVLFDELLSLVHNFSNMHFERCIKLYNKAIKRNFFDNSSRNGNSNPGITSSQIQIHGNVDPTSPWGNPLPCWHYLPSHHPQAPSGYPIYSPYLS